MYFLFFFKLKMIKILDTDNIIDIVNKINDCQEKEIILDFPYWHSILHNYMSLKILKNKAWIKRITIVTKDVISKKIWEPLWINYSILTDYDTLDNSTKQYIMKHNFSFFEYLKFEIKKYYHRFLKFIGKKTHLEEIIYKNPYNKVKASAIFFLMLWVFLSISMLIFVFYFAVNKTYVEITPEISVKTKAINMSFIEENWDEKIFWNTLVSNVKKIESTISLNYTHKTTAIDYENTSRAKWEVTLINELRDEQIFKPKTRLLTTDWLLFETDDWVKIPPKMTLSWQVVLWTAKANITAKITDNTGKFIWTRWNISKHQVLTIPWLKFNQDKIYAKLEKPTSWWQDNIVYMVWEDDIENSKTILSNMLKKEVLEKLKQKISEESKISWINYEILWIKDILKYKNEDIKITTEIKPWQKIPSFDLYWTITLETYVYNKDQALSQLKKVIQDSLITWTDKLMFIDDKSLKTTVVLSKIENPLKLKATVEIDMWLSYNFDNNINFYNKKLKTLISWLSNDEAKNILLNEDRISNVSIKNTPFFIKKVSWNPDNIILKIKNKYN